MGYLKEIGEKLILTKVFPVTLEVKERVFRNSIYNVDTFQRNDLLTVSEVTTYVVLRVEVGLDTEMTLSRRGPGNPAGFPNEGGCRVDSGQTYSVKHPSDHTFVLSRCVFSSIPHRSGHLKGFGILLSPPSGHHGFPCPLVDLFLQRVGQL